MKTIGYFLKQKLQAIENLPFREFVNFFIELSPYEKDVTMKILYFIVEPENPKIYDIPNKYYFLFECNQEEYKIKHFMDKGLILAELQNIYEDINETLMDLETNSKKIAQEFFQNDSNLRMVLQSIFEKTPIKDIPKDVLIKNKSKKNFELKFLLKYFTTQIFNKLNEIEIDKIEDKIENKLNIKEQ